MTESHLDSEKDKYISMDEACRLLETDQSEIENLIGTGNLHAFRLGDKLLRFRKDQVSEIKAKWRINRDLFSSAESRQHMLSAGKSGWMDSVRDFVYFNDFYIVCFLIIAVLLYLILSSQ